MKYCPHCGKQTEDYANFCAACGYDFSKISTNSQDPVQESPIPQNPPKRPGLPKKMLLIAGLCTVILLAALITLPILFKKDITLKDNTIALGEQDYQSVLLSNVETAQQYKLEHTTIDPNVLGSYEAVFTLTDKNGTTKTETLTVKVVDKTPPEMTLQSVKKLIAFPNDEDSIYTYIKLTDNVDTDLAASSETVKISGVNFSEIGSYKAHIEIYDHAGNQKSYDDYPVEIVYPEMSLGDYLTDYFAAPVSSYTYSDTLEASISSEKELSFHCQNFEDINNYEGVTFNLTDMTGRYSKNVNKGLTAADYTLSADGTITGKSTSYMYNFSFSSFRTGVYVSESELVNQPFQLYLDVKNAIDNDALLKQLGSIDYFLGKSAAEYQDRIVNLKDKTIS